MSITTVKSYSDFKEKINNKETSYLLVYKSGSKESDCALENMQAVASDLEDIEIFSVDVNQVKDIHTKYSISSAPSLLEFVNGKYSNVVKGCHDKSYYENLFDNIAYVSKAKKEGKKIHNVIVYTTSTCSWCITLKKYLDSHGIRFKEINITENEAEGERMVQKSGHQGVPQTEIDGKMVIGFDTNKLDKLLELKN